MVKTMLICCAATLFSAHAVFKEGDIVVAVEGNQVTQSFHGYLVHSFLVSNMSPDKEHVVELSMKGWGGSSQIKRMAKEVVVEPQTRLKVELLQLPVRFYGADFAEVRIDGKESRTTVRLPYSASQHLNARQSGIFPSGILFSRSVNRDEMQNQFNQKLGTIFSQNSWERSDFNFERSETEPERWSDNWLSYTRFEGVVLTADDYSRMPADTRDALKSYVYAGGTLLKLGAKHPETMGWSDTRNSKKNTEVSRLGFGFILSSSILSVDKLSHADLDIFKMYWRKNSGFWQNEWEKREASKKFPVVEEITFPFMGTFLCLFLFAVGAGPVSIMLLSKKNRRIWLFWTTPVLALITSFTVIMYFLFSEGIVKKVRVEGFTVLDHSADTAVSLFRNAFYCTIRPSDGLHYSYDTEVTPCTSRYGSESGSRTIRFDKDQHLLGDWIQSRLPSYFLFRKVEKRRERVEISDSEGVAKALNGLGADIQTLYYADKQGVIYRLDNLGAGAKETMKRTEFSSVVTKDFLQSVYSGSGWIPSLSDEDMERNPGRFLFPNSYLAIMDEGVFMENGFGSTKGLDLQSRAHVYGILEKGKGN